MKRNVISIGISCFFILLFLYSGIYKIVDYRIFRADLYGLASLKPFSGWIAWMIPAIELIIPVLLFRRAWRIVGLYVSCGLMIVFTVYYILSANHVSCGCGGILERLSPKQHITFNVSCIVLSLLGILQSYLPNNVKSYKWASSFVTILLLLNIGWVITDASMDPRNKKTGLEGKPPPSFSLLLVDNATRINMNEIPEGKPIVIVQFSPYCLFCQAEILDIIEHIQYLKNTQIYLVTTFPQKDLKLLYDKYQLQKYGNIKAGTDSTNAFISYYKVSVIPYTTIYDSQKRLIRAWPGRADINSLIRFTKN